MKWLNEHAREVYIAFFIWAFAHIIIQADWFTWLGIITFGTIGVIPWINYFRKKNYSLKRKVFQEN